MTWDSGRFSKLLKKSMTWDMGHSAGREPQLAATPPPREARLFKNPRDRWDRRCFSKSLNTGLTLADRQKWSSVSVRINLLSYRSAQTRLFVSMLFAIYHCTVRLRRLQPELNCGSIFQPACMRIFWCGAGVSRPDL